jgi:hypothetical protein
MKLNITGCTTALFSSRCSYEHIIVEIQRLVKKHRLRIPVFTVLRGCVMRDIL